MKNTHAHDLRRGMYASVRLQSPATESAPYRRAVSEVRDALVHLVSHAGLARLAAVPALAADEAMLARIGEGQVLAVAESSVIDTGLHKYVYRQSEPPAPPGTYDCVAVELGPRSGEFYPLLRGLAPGDLIVTHGSFLIDAETRLSAGVGSTYFGASGGPASTRGGVRPSMIEDEQAKVNFYIDKLDAADRKLARQQEFCVVLQKSRLGSMGKPIKLQILGETVFLCCKGCEGGALENPQKTLEVLRKLRARKPHEAPPPPPKVDTDEAAIRANLAKLSPQLRKLAEAQRWCPVSDARLGIPEMGVPVTVEVRGQTVLLCCAGCRNEATRNADKTLATVEGFKKKAAAQK
jgi:hypothetical protein